MTNRLITRIAGLATVVLFLGSAHAEGANQPPHLKLIRVLPAKVSGFVADEPQGSTIKVTGLNMAEASRVYYQKKKDAPERVTVKITDGANSQFLPTAPDPAAQFSSDSTEGSQQSFTLDGYPAMERYDVASKSGSLLVFIGGRYLVEIESKGLERSALQQWWKKIAVKKLMRS
jgi:hypothetical protein